VGDILRYLGCHPRNVLDIPLSTLPKLALSSVFYIYELVRLLDCNVSMEVLAEHSAFDTLSSHRT